MAHLTEDDQPLHFARAAVRELLPPTTETPLLHPGSGGAVSMGQGQVTSSHPHGTMPPGDLPSP